MAPPTWRSPQMIPRARLGARLLAGALALTLLPAPAFAQEPSPPVNPWKLGYARRMADERMANERAERGGTPEERRGGGRGPRPPAAAAREKRPAGAPPPPGPGPAGPTPP